MHSVNHKGSSRLMLFVVTEQDKVGVKLNQIF